MDDKKDKFQSTPLHEGRLPTTSSCSPSCARFNPRPCTRGDRARRSAPWRRRGFNPRPCTRGDGPLEVCQGSVKFQSTPLHEGRLSSIAGSAASWMFQSTPLHEGRPRSIGLSRMSTTFQSTPLHEGRPDRLRVRVDQRIVSIHAPARGATAKKQSFEVVAYFKRNPRTVGKNRRFRLPSLL